MAQLLPFALSRDPFGKLVLTDADGEAHVGVVPVRCFPFTEPERFISLCDSTGHELACVNDPDALDAATRELLLAEVRRREFLPVILEIHSVSGISEPCEWDVVTDRGATKFVLNSEDDVRRLGPHRALITDAQGVRYQIHDARRLNPEGRRIIERYL